MTVFSVIYGVSSGGKTPTIAAIKSRGCIDFYEPPVIKSWECRPYSMPRDKEDEAVWNNQEYFLPKDKDIRALANNPQYITTEFRGHCQAFNLQNVLNSPKQLVFRDLYYTFIPGLKQSTYLNGKVDIRTIFFSPFEEEEIKNNLGKDSFKQHIYSKMSQILALRSMRQKGQRAYDESVMQDNEIRAITAYYELEASRFADYIVHNPFPEEHPAWGYVDLQTQEGRLPSQGVIEVVKKVERILSS